MARSSSRPPQFIRQTPSCGNFDLMSLPLTFSAWESASFSYSTTWTLTIQTHAYRSLVRRLIATCSRDSTGCTCSTARPHAAKNGSGRAMQSITAKVEAIRLTAWIGSGVTGDKSRQMYRKESETPCI